MIMLRIGGLAALYFFSGLSTTFALGMKLYGQRISTFKERTFLQQEEQEAQGRLHMHEQHHEFLADPSTPSCPDQAPRVFVYGFPPKELLSHGTRDIVWREDAYCERELPSGSAEERDCVFGPEFSVTIDSPPANVTLRATDQFRNGRIFQSRLVRSACRVTDPTRADVFFVPIWRENYKVNRTECPTEDEVLAALPYLSDETASKHFLMSPRVGGLWDDVCPFWNSEKPLLQKIRKMALEDTACGKEDRPERSIPYPTLGGGLNSTQLAHLFAVADKAQETGREFLVMATLGKRVGISSARVRDVWNQHCHDSDHCIAVDPTVAGMLPGLVQAMMKSTFCLQPEGDTPSRKGMLDSLALGCIPVLSSRKQHTLWRWHLGDHDWEDFSVLAPDSTQAAHSTTRGNKPTQPGQNHPDTTPGQNDHPADEDGGQNHPAEEDGRQDEQDQSTVGKGPTSQRSWCCGDGEKKSPPAVAQTLMETGSSGVNNIVEFLETINATTIAELRAGVRSAREKIITHWTDTDLNDAITVTLKAIQDGK
ncbi:unnamed protein product [Amoebophrya sp. A120]|nr:unnamed protein product [Amoebophrya sp. A120]|eukprot:GSA120T00023873001.1